MKFGALLLLTLIGVLLFPAVPASALNVAYPIDGGTGIGSVSAGDVGTCLKVLDDSPFTYELGACGSGGGGGGFDFPAVAAWGNSTSTPLGFLAGFLSVGSSTIVGNATTTGNHAFGSVRIPSLTSELLEVDASGNVGEATAGTDYEVPLSVVYPIVRTINAISLAFGTSSSNTWGGTQTFTNAIAGNITGTASALAANGADCSAGNFPLGVDAAGAVANCTDAWTEAENTAAAYTAQSRQLTVAGTANQITSSAGAQTLAADRTWTLSLPSHVILPGSYFAATGSTTNATSTNLTVTGQASTTALTVSGLNAAACDVKASTAGVLSCGTDATTAGGANSKWATTTSTSIPNAIYPNGGVNTLVGIGTTTPFATLQVGTTSGRGVAISNPGAAAGLKHWLIGNDGSGTFSIGTSSDAYATSSPALQINSNRQISFSQTTPFFQRTFNVMGDGFVVVSPDQTKGFRSRFGGSTDFEFTGDAYFSTWGSSAFSGSQYVQFVLKGDGSATEWRRAITFNSDRSADQDYRFHGDTVDDILMLDVSANSVGIATSTPSSRFQIFNTGTSTISIDSNSATQGSCIEMKDRDGTGYTYTTGNNGVLTTSTVSCK